MECLRCGYCCKDLAVVIVDDPEKGITKDNLIIYECANKMNGYPYFISENSMDDDTTDSDYAFLFCGNFDYLIFGFWGGIDLLIDVYTSASTATTKIHSNLYLDIVLLHGESFAVVNNIRI